MLTNRLVCIVEASDAYRTFLQELFDQYLPNYPVHLFSSGRVFLDKLSQMRRLPSLILLDQHVLESDGYQTLLALKKDSTYSMLPVVIMSYNAETIDIDSLHDLGVNSYVAKAVDVPFLKETLSNLCHYWLDFNQLPISKE